METIEIVGPGGRRVIDKKLLGRFLNEGYTIVGDQSTDIIATPEPNEEREVEDDLFPEGDK